MNVYGCRRCSLNMVVGCVALLSACSVHVPEIAGINSNGATGSSGEMQPAAGEGSQSEAPSQEATTQAAAVDELARQRGHIQLWTTKIAETSTALDNCCGDQNLLDDLTRTYPSTDFVKLYKDVRGYSSNYSEAERKLPEYAEAEQKMDALNQKLTAAIRLPEDKYKQSDAESVRESCKKVAEKYSELPALKVVVVDEDWGRQSGSQWIGERLVNYDQGFVRSFVAVKKSDEVAQIWLIVARKDWLDAEKLKFDSNVPAAVAEMAISNLPK